MNDPAPGEETVDADDLLEDPRTDIEALCLGALLWSPAAAAQRVTDMLDPTDFNRPVYAELFTVITGQVTAGVPHDPASIAAALTRAGESASHHGGQLRHALTQATLSGAPAESVEHYARTVISAAYRRSYHVAATSMAQAAAELPEDQLFEHLLTIGRAQRAASHRMADIRR